MPATRKRVELDEFGGVVVSGPNQEGASPGPTPTPTPGGGGAGPSPLGTPSGLGGVAVGGIKGLLDRGIGAGGLVEKLVGNPMMQLVAPGAQSPAALLGLPGALETARQEFATPAPGPEQIGFMGERAAEFAAGAAGPIRAGLGAIGSRLAGRGAEAAGVGARLIAPSVMRFATGIPPRFTARAMDMLGIGGAGGKAAAAGLEAAPIAATAGEVAASKTAVEGARAANAGLQFAAKEAAKRAEAVAAKVAAARAKGAVPGHGFVPKGLAREAEQAEAAVGFLRANTQASSTLQGIQLPTVNVVEKVRRVAAEPVRQAARAAAPKAATKSKEELMNELGSLLMKGKPR